MSSTAPRVDASFGDRLRSRTPMAYEHGLTGDPRLDLDRGSFGIVKVLEDRPGTTYPDLTWEPKPAFAAVAAAYAE